MSALAIIRHTQTPVVPMAASTAPEGHYLHITDAFIQIDSKVDLL